MVEKEKAIDKLKSVLEEMVRRNAKLEELAVANLNYLKPRVRKFLNEGIDFSLKEVLTETEEKMVRFYLGLNGTGKMRSLEETATHLGYSPKSKNLIGATLRYCWVKLKRREIVGPEAIETLKLFGPIYLNLVERGVSRVDDILVLPDDQIRGICGTEWGLFQLKEAVQKRGID